MIHHFTAGRGTSSFQLLEAAYFGMVDCHYHCIVVGYHDYPYHPIVHRDNGKSLYADIDNILIQLP